MSYPKHRKPAVTIVCEICGKIFNKRGYRGHLWLKHGLKNGIKENEVQVSSLDNSSKEGMTVDEYLDFKAEKCLKEGMNELRVETLRNFQATIGIVDEYSTGQFMFRKKNDRYFSIQRLNACDE